MLMLMLMLMLFSSLLFSSQRERKDQDYEQDQDQGLLLLQQPLARAGSSLPATRRARRARRARPTLRPGVPAGRRYQMKNVVCTLHVVFICFDIASRGSLV